MKDIALTDLHGNAITPEGCAAEGCGVPRRAHVQLWTPQARWHSYEQPIPQLIARRIRVLRRLRDEQLVENSERVLAKRDADALGEWLHGDGTYGRAAR